MAKRKQAKVAKEKQVQLSPEPDPIGERLIADGFAANSFLLDLNGVRAAYEHEPYSFPWNLPSRLFTWPVDTRRGPDGVRRITLRHPLLVEHPFAQELLAKGYELCPPEECIDEYGGVEWNGNLGTWWHAVDLIENPQELLQTRQFTTDEDIAGAVSYRCSYPRKSPLPGLLREMRSVMTALGIPEPTTDDSRSIMREFHQPSLCKSEEGTERWPINTHRALKSADSTSIAWAYIHGIEQGWFENKNGFLQWSPRGRAIFDGAPVTTHTNTSPARPLAPEQSQMSLF